MLKHSVILTSKLHIMVPIIKVVGDFCNLRCRYCFYHTRDQQTPSIMSDDLLDKFIFQYLNIFRERASFVWHGGEPLLAGIDFFKRIVVLQKKYAKVQFIQNYVQTNGTLLNDDWASFFKSNNFRVGVSLDGCEQSHDKFRKKYQGDGSFNLVMKGVDILLRHGIRPGFIQTLPKANLSQIRKDFNFFAQLFADESVVWGINSYLDPLEMNHKMLDEQITNREFITYLKKYINLWLMKNDSRLQIREIDYLVARLLGKEVGSCAYNGNCTGYFCLDYNGKVYPCDRFAGQQEFLFGDLSKQSLINILNSDQRLSYAKKVNSLPNDCKKCEWQKLCNNGCSHHRVGGVDGKYYYCETRRTIFSFFQKKLDNLRLAD